MRSKSSAREKGPDSGPPKSRGKGKTQLDRIFVFDREQDAAADAGANRGLAKRISRPPIAALGDG
jgi:hypothetical protein